VKRKNRHAVALGKKGGEVKSEKKAKACRRNGLISAIKRQIRREQAAAGQAQNLIVDTERSV
jgi:hypothetical protein